MDNKQFDLEILGTLVEYYEKNECLIQNENMSEHDRNKAITRRTVLVSFINRMCMACMPEYREWNIETVKEYLAAKNRGRH